MKAVKLYAYGSPEELKYEETELPKYGDNEVLVKVKATSVNPIDLKVRSGAAQARMPVEFPVVLGRDLSGEVVAVGRNVTAFAKGMRVMGLSNATYADYAVANADILSRIPDSLEFEQAAAIPLVTLTGAQLIERAVKPESGQTVLVTGALGSVGRSAVHVARKHGARVLAGVRSTEKDRASQLSVDGIVAIDNEAETDQLHDLDAIADTVGGAAIQRLLHSIRKGGVLGSVLGVPDGSDKNGIRVEAIMAKPDPSRLYELTGDFARQEFSIPVARVMKLHDIREAHRLVESGRLGGKIILVP